MVLDEPTAGLDPSAKVEIMGLIKKLHESGKTIILVTHDMDVVMKYASKVIVLNDSKLIKITTPERLFNEPNVEQYSLEIPTLYKFKNLLKKYGFKPDISNSRKRQPDQRRGLLRPAGAGALRRFPLRRRDDGHGGAPPAR